MILSVIRSTDCHPTAAWVFEQMNNERTNLSMGTVYRNIKILVDQSLVQRIEAGSSCDRFDGNTEPHYHFICRACGAVDDLPIEPLRELEEAVNRVTSYKVEGHRLDFQGICPNCIEH